MEASKEESKTVALNFLRIKMNMTLDDEEVEVAHRLGSKVSTKPRPMVIRCKPSLRDRIFNYTKNLKDLKNDQDDYFSVKPQLPEPLQTERKEREERIKEVKKANAQIPDEEAEKRIKIEVKNKTLYLNGVAQKVHIKPPTVQDVFEMSSKEQQKAEEINFAISTAEEERESVFRAAAVRVKNSTEIRIAYKKVKHLFPESDNVILAYVLKDHTGWSDDYEHGAGKKTLQLLLNRGQTYTAVFILRKFGGIHLGPRRFLYMQKVAKEALDKLSAEPY